MSNTRIDRVPALRAGARENTRMTFGAASVALFLSVILSPAQAANPAVNIYNVDGVRNADGHFEARYHIQRRFAQNDPVWPGRVDYVSKNVKIEKRGNPLSWIKKSPFEIGTFAAIAAAGWAIDELTNQVTSVGYVDDPSYSPGYYWRTLGYLDSTPARSCKLYASGTGRTFTSVTEKSSSWGTIYNCNMNGGAVVENTERRTCSGTPSYCQPPEKVEENTPVPDADVWKEIDKVVDASPDYYKNWWVKDPVGNPYIYPEPAAARDDIADDLGVDPYPEAVKVTNPLEGQGLAPDGLPSGEPVPTPEVAKENAPLEIPDDYAREETLKDVWDRLKEYFDPSEINQEPDIAVDTPAADLFKDLTDEFTNLPDLPTIVDTPDFGISNSASCQTINLNCMGANVIFPSNSQCDKLNTAKQILGWLIYVLTWFGCVHIILGARRLQA